jgi:hypothetical protein
MCYTVCGFKKSLYLHVDPQYTLVHHYVITVYVPYRCISIYSCNIPLGGMLNIHKYVLVSAYSTYREVRGGFWSGCGSGGRSRRSGGTGVQSLLVLGSCDRGLALIILLFLGLPSGGFMSYLRMTFPIASIDSLG